MTITVNPSRDELEPYVGRLFDPFLHYINTVSPRAMALPIETCALLYWACETRRAEAVCDLGSGFTSYVLRRYAAEADYPVTVHSVDDADYWLRRSAAFCEVKELPHETGFMLGEEWLAGDIDYDVIVHDYSGGQTRNEFAAHAADRLAPWGYLIFDDAQNYSHHAAFSDVCRDRDLVMFDVWAQTIDEIGRYAALAVSA